MNKNLFKSISVFLAFFMLSFFMLGICPDLERLFLRMYKVSVSAEELNPLNDSDAPVVAIIDSGYRYNAGFDETKIIHQYNVIDDTYNVNDDYGHGSAMLATLIGYNGEVCIEGINPDANVVVIKATNSNGAALPEMLIDAISYAIDLDVDIINISLGMVEHHELLQYVIEDAIAEGIQIVAAVGDTNESQALYPAAYEGVHAIEAQAPDGTRYVYSNDCQNAIRIPGVNIETIGYDKVKNEWKGINCSGSSIASIIYTSLLSRGEPLDMEYLLECKEYDMYVECDLPQYIAGLEMDSDYEELVGMHDSLSSFDHEFIIQYGDYVFVDNGLYVFDYTANENDSDEVEDVAFINQNITEINNLVNQNLAYINESGDLVFYGGNNVFSQFGFTRVKYYWYGIDAVADADMFSSIAGLSLIAKILTDQKARALTNGQMLSDSDIYRISSTIEMMMNSTDFLMMGTTFMRAFTQSFGDFSGFLNELYDTLYIYLTYARICFAAINAASGGITSIILVVINYILNSFIPTIESSVIALIGTAIGYYCSGTISVRVFYGWGTALTGR